MSSEQDERSKVKSTTRTSIRFTTYLMSPLMLGLAAVSESFVALILTEKWLPCVHLMQLFCLFYLFHPIQTANTQAIKALGRSDLVLKLEIFRDVIQLVVTLIVMWISVDAIVISMAVMSFFFVFVNAYPNIKLLSYSLREQLGDIIPSIGIAAIMAIIVYFVGKINAPLIIILPIQIVIGSIIYVLLSLLTKNTVFLYFASKLKLFLWNNCHNKGEQSK